MIEIDIINFEKYNPRKDYKTKEWFRLESMFFKDEKFFEITDLELSIFLKLVGLRQNTQKIITFEKLDWLCKQIDANIKTIDATLKSINARKLIYYNYNIDPIRDNITLHNTVTNELRSEPIESDRIRTDLTETEKEKPKIDFEEYVEFWNLCICQETGKGQVLKLSKSRKDKLMLRIKEGLTMDILKSIREKINESDFLRGKKINPNGKTWCITFDWLIENDKNWLKVIENRYSNKKEGI